MKHSLPQRPLRLATAQAYDAPLRGSGSFWVERSVEEFSLDEPIGATHGHEDVADATADNTETGERPYQYEERRPVCTNPLSDEPSAAAIGTVKRFGVVGLVTVAVSAGIARWWNSLSSRDH